MKKRMSVRNFKEFCERSPLQEIVFSAENQNWYRESNPCKLQLTFPTMLIGEHPNLICLKSDHGNILFDQIQYVEVDTGGPMPWTEITVFCGGEYPWQEDVAYTLIAV